MDRVRALQTEADELASRERTLLGEIRRLEIDRQIRTEELGVIDGDLAETTGQLEDTATRISDLEREADAQRPLVEARLVALYKMGTPRYTRLLLGAGDLRARGRNYRLIGSLARRDREQFDDLRETVTDLQVSRSTLEARQVEVAALQEAARAARRALDRTIASQTALVEEIDTRRDLTAQLAGELEAAREQLEAPLAELAAGGSPGATTLALPLRPFRGQIEPPVPGEVTVPFGAPRPTEFGTTIAGGGIELAATPGESVYAIHEGEVVSVGTFEGLGTLVIVSHGDQAFSLYGYLASLAVHEGGQVDERAELGTAGVSPTSDATVYFELRIDGRPVDPVEWLKQ
jgi:septal ring factor EnvC (AmiA/AmiB activator)